MADASVKATASADLYAYPPFVGYPARGQNFENSSGNNEIKSLAKGGGLDAAADDLLVVLF